MGFEKTLGSKIGVQFFPVFGGKFLLPGFPADGSVLFVNLFVGSVVGDMGKGGINDLYPAFRFSDVGLGGKYLPADFIQIGVKALHGGDLFLPQKVKGFHDLVEIADSSFQLPLGSPAGAFLAPHIQIPGKQFGDGRLLCLFQCFQQRRLFLFRVGQPAL